MFVQIIAMTVSMSLSIIAVLANIFLYWNQQRIKADFKKNEFVHKLQFEKEFIMYESVWEIVFKLKGEMFNLNSDGISLFPFKDFNQSKLQYVTIATESNNSFKEIINQNRPFLFKDIFSSLNELSEMNMRNINFVMLYYSANINTNIDERIKKDFEDKCKNTIIAYNSKMESISDRISERIQIIS